MLSLCRADVVIATDKEEIEPIVKKITEGKGVYGGMDAVAGDMTATLISCVRPGGRILIYGTCLSQSIIWRACSKLSQQPAILLLDCKACTENFKCIEGQN